jgi:dUTP pyrophosphatase
MTTVQLQIIDKRLNNSGKSGTFSIPDYATTGAAGIDLRAMFDTDKDSDFFAEYVEIDNAGTHYIEIGIGETILIPTGIAVKMPHENMAVLLLPRSGLGHKNGIVLGNLVGLGDSDYTKQLYVSCWNRNKSGEPFRINLGDRIAQAVFVPIIKPTFEIVDSFEDNGRGSFGHTGI